MKLNFLKEIALKTLKKNININLNNYCSETNSWIFDFFEEKNPFLQLKREIPQFKLDMSEEKPEKSDFKNIEILYSSLKGLSTVEAANENLWAGLSHSTFWKYIQYRSSIVTDAAVTPSVEKISSSFFFNREKNSLITHPLSKLWWSGYIVYEEGKENPFELLKVFEKDFKIKLNYLFSSNFSNNPKITKAFLTSIYEFEKNGVQINRKIFNELIMYLNILGGTYILDYFDTAELKEKITRKIDTLIFKEY